MIKSIYGLIHGSKFIIKGIDKAFALVGRNSTGVCPDYL